MLAASWLIALILAQSPPTDAAANPVLADLRERGVEAGGKRVDLPMPKLPDGLNAAASRAVLAEIAGGERAVADFTRDSVTAPFVLKTSDLKADGATIRSGDLYFVVHADLDALDIRRALGTADEATTEAGNMRFTTRTLQGADLAPLKLTRLDPDPRREEWYTHATGRLLDRISVESTSRAVATRTADSWTIATRTDPRFDADTRLTNRWATIARVGATETVGPRQRYSGGGSTIKVTRLAAVPGALLVEGHFAFVEPTAWFDGNPILRSKFGLICQDQVRQLRREIQKRRAGK